MNYAQSTRHGAQLFDSQLFLIGMMYSIQIWLPSLWTLEGERDGSVMVHRLVQSLPSVMVANWGLWVPAQVINFRFVPTKFQVLYSNFVALVWNVYLSYSQTRKQARQEEEHNHENGGV